MSSTSITLVLPTSAYPRSPCFSLPPDATRATRNIAAEPLTDAQMKPGIALSVLNASALTPSETGMADTDNTNTTAAAKSTARRILDHFDRVIQSCSNASCGHAVSPQLIIGRIVAGELDVDVTSA